MKLVLISDSHGNKSGIDKLFSTFQFDYLFFMGDGLGDIGLYENLDNVVVVSGNCDFFSRVPNERILELEDLKVLVTHGNKYGVKLGLGKLIEKAKQEEVDLVFYGHTHVRKYEKIGDIYFINPGKFAKNSGNESCGIIVNIEEGEVRIEEFKI